MLSFIFIGSIFAISDNNIAYATDSTTFTTNQVTNNYVSKEVAATFGYSIIDEEQHFVSVRITNKTVATKAVIPSTVEIDGETYTVTEIAASGFASSTLLKRVTLANTIKKIGNSAFTNCSKLEHVFLSNVETIGNYAFMRCSNLSKVVIPASVQTIGSNVFRTNATAIEARLAEAPATWSSTWNSNNSGTVTYNSQYFVTYGEPLPNGFATIPTKLHYVFSGFYDEINGQGNKYYENDMTSLRNCDIGTDFTLYAYWTPFAYSINYSHYYGENTNPSTITIEDLVDGPYVLSSIVGNGYIRRFFNLCFGFFHIAMFFRNSI